jgi:hypothetical protein
MKWGMNIICRAGAVGLPLVFFLVSVSAEVVFLFEEQEILAA